MAYTILFLRRSVREDRFDAKWKKIKEKEN